MTQDRVKVSAEPRARISVDSRSMDWKSCREILALRSFKSMISTAREIGWPSKRYGPLSNVARTEQVDGGERNSEEPSALQVIRFVSAMTFWPCSGNTMEEMLWK
jgi:hypothetical protein